MKYTITIILAFAVLFGVAGGSFAATPPTTTSPANNTFYFGNVGISCSGTTADVTNYTFRVSQFSRDTVTPSNYSVYASQLAGGNSAFVVGNNYSYPNELNSSNAGTADVYVTSWVGVNTDNLTLNIIHHDEGLGTDVKIYLNGTEMLDVGAAGNVSINTTKYNNANRYNFTVLILDSDSGNGEVRWWGEWENIYADSDGNAAGTSSINSYGLGLWECRACNATDCSAYTNYSTVIGMNTTDCSAGNIALNFTIFNEEVTTELLASTFSVEFVLNATNGEEMNAEKASVSNHNICLNPGGSSANVTGFVEWLPDNTSYTFNRQYYFSNAVINSSNRQDINLYSLKDDLATLVTFNVLRNGVPVSDIIIQLQRFIVGEGIFNLVAMGETNSQGQDVIPLRLSDAFYKVIAVEDGDIVFDGGSQHISSSTYNIYLGADPSITNYANGYTQLDNLAWNLSFNASGTNAIVLSALDTTGASTKMCLRVERYDAENGSEVINYECVTTSSASLSYTITNLTQTHVAQFVAYKDDIYRIMDQITVRLTTILADLIDEDGLFYAALIVISLSFLGLFNPQAAVILALVGIVASFILGLLPIAWASIIGLIIAGGILAYKIK